MFSQPPLEILRITFSHNYSNITLIIVTGLIIDSGKKYFWSRSVITLITIPRNFQERKYVVTVLPTITYKVVDLHILCWWLDVRYLIEILFLFIPVLLCMLWQRLKPLQQWWCHEVPTTNGVIPYEHNKWFLYTQSKQPTHPPPHPLPQTKLKPIAFMCYCFVFSSICHWSWLWMGFSLRGKKMSSSITSNRWQKKSLFLEGKLFC